MIEGVPPYGNNGYWNNIYQKSLRSPEGIMSKMPLILSLNIMHYLKKDLTNYNTTRKYILKKYSTS
jgi:hypothetical protein